MRLSLKKLPIDVKSFAYALFLVAGLFKADPRVSWIGMDLTLICACVILWFVVLAIVAARHRFPRGLWVGLAMFLLFMPAVLWSDLTDAWAYKKVVLIFTTTFLAFLAPFFLVQNLRDLHRFFASYVLIAFIMGFDALTRLARGDVQLTAFVADTISLARVAGFALIVLIFMVMGGRMRLVVAAAPMLFLAFVLIGTGSKGPLTGVLLGTVAVSLSLYWHRLRRVARFAMIGVVLLSAADQFADLIPSWAYMRLARYMAGDFRDRSISDRQELARVALRTIPDHPAGLGWGSFKVYIAGDVVHMPHNLVLEIFYEAGWVAGIAFLVLLAGVGMRLFRHRFTLDVALLLALFLFDFVNILVSGEMNSEKPFWALVALASLPLSRLGVVPRRAPAAAAARGPGARPLPVPPRRPLPSPGFGPPAPAPGARA